MHRTSRILLALAAALLLGAAPPTGGELPSVRKVDGKSHMLLGAGQTADYSLALYIEESEARRHVPALAMRAGGRTKQRLVAGEHTPAFVVWGRFTKILVLRAEKALPADRLRAQLSAGISEDLGDKASPELKKWAGELVALVDDLDAGDELVITVDGDGRVYFEQDGERHEAPQSAKLARALVGVWLGNHPVSLELRRKLIDHIDQLVHAQ